MDANAAADAGEQLRVQALADDIYILEEREAARAGRQRHGPAVMKTRDTIRVLHLARVRPLVRHDDLIQDRVEPNKPCKQHRLSVGDHGRREGDEDGTHRTG